MQEFKSIENKFSPNEMVENKIPLDKLTYKGNEDISILIQNFLPRTGTWEKEEGNSIWHPHPDNIPDPENKKGGNPSAKTWKEILDHYGIDSIVFRDGYPVFDPVAIESVEIDDFSTERWKNFGQADELLAKKWSAESHEGRDNWSSEEVANWRKEHGYTWHEHQDCKTLQLVPCEVHNNVPHEGGISVKKQNQNSSLQ